MSLPRLSTSSFFFLAPPHHILSPLLSFVLPLSPFPVYFLFFIFIFFLSLSFSSPHSLFLPPLSLYIPLTFSSSSFIPTSSSSSPSSWSSHPACLTHFLSSISFSYSLPPPTSVLFLSVCSSSSFFPSFLFSLLFLHLPLVFFLYCLTSLSLLLHSLLLFLSSASSFSAFILLSATSSSSSLPLTLPHHIPSLLSPLSYLLPPSFVWHFLSFLSSSSFHPTSAHPSFLLPPTSSSSSRFPSSFIIIFHSSLSSSYFLPSSPLLFIFVPQFSVVNI